MNWFKQLILLFLSVFAFAFSFYAIAKFMLFVSVPGQVKLQYVWIANLLDNKSRLATAFPAIVNDMVYIILFILQHSLLKSDIVKSVWQKLGLTTAERTIYCLTSSLSLWYLVKNWMPTPTIVVWQLDIQNSSPLWWAFVVTHIFAWTVIYGGSIIMDLPEILGLKQIYYDIRNYASPIAYKSFELRHLYGHVRHPSFTGFCAILWISNVMSLDRFILATIFTLYMYVAWSTDHNDIIYHKCQLKRKREEIWKPVQNIS